ncbi:hypothetical protein EU527_17700 [Candidatus Thorarchaeota archaeon]|nr:MAG: hypothetical protein EU527_17700 [Candidatus Thorarchaeota archaeon]
MFQQIDVHYVEGWEEIRAALAQVEKARQKGQDAKIEITNSNVDTILKITLRSIDELDKYFKSTLRQMILKGANEDTSTVIGKIIM